jgi:hypothetical protein
MRHRVVGCTKTCSDGCMYTTSMWSHTLGICSVKFLCRVLRSTSVGNLEIAMSPRKDPPALTFGPVYHCGVVRHGWRKVPRSNITARNRGNRREFVLKWLPNMHDKKRKKQ